MMIAVQVIAEAANINNYNITAVNIAEILITEAINNITTAEYKINR